MDVFNLFILFIDFENVKIKIPCSLGSQGHRNKEAYQHWVDVRYKTCMQLHRTALNKHRDHLNLPSFSQEKGGNQTKML